MDAKDTASLSINEEKKETTSVLRKPALYFDISLLQRENFVRYLAAIVLR